MEKGRREGGEAKKNKFLFALDYGYLKPKEKSRCACWGTIIDFGLGHGVLISARQCDNSNYIIAGVVSNNYILELLT